MVLRLVKENFNEDNSRQLPSLISGVRGLALSIYSVKICSYSVNGQLKINKSLVLHDDRSVNSYHVVSVKSMLKRENIIRNFFNLFTFQLLSPKPVPTLQ